MIDQLRLSAWTAEVLNSRGVVSRTLKRTCKGELFTSNLLGFEEVFALKSSTSFEFLNLVDEYKSTSAKRAVNGGNPLGANGHRLTGVLPTRNDLIYIARMSE